MTQNTPASLASALVAAVLVLATWTSTLALPSAHAAEAQASVATSVPANVILA